MCCFIIVHVRLDLDGLCHSYREEYKIARILSPEEETARGHLLSFASG